MAIQAIPNSKTAYQGSVPGTEQVNPIVEKAADVSGAEAAPAKKAEQTSDRTQAAPNGNTTGNETAVPGTEALKKAAEEINRHLTNSEAVFGVHDRTNRITIKIVDKETREVLKEYPPEKTLDMIAKVWEMAGIMVDEKR